MRIQLYETRDMLAGAIVYPWSEAETVLSRYAAFSATMPDELGVPVTMTSGPDGQPAIMLVPPWNGNKLQGERAMDHLQALGKPQLTQAGPMTYTDMLAPIDARVAEADGCFWETRTRWLPAFAPGAVDAILAAVARRTSPHSIANWDHFHGAATRISQSLSACGRSISWWRSSRVGSPTGVTALRTGNGRGTSGKASLPSLCRVATPVGAE
jgi:hypothetical protein